MLYTNWVHSFCSYYVTTSFNMNIKILKPRTYEWLTPLALKICLRNWFISCDCFLYKLIDVKNHQEIEGHNATETSTTPCFQPPKSTISFPITKNTSGLLVVDILKRSRLLELSAKSIIIFIQTLRFWFSSPCESYSIKREVVSNGHQARAWMRTTDAAVSFDVASICEIRKAILSS